MSRRKVIRFPGIGELDPPSVVELKDFCKGVEPEYIFLVALDQEEGVLQFARTRDGVFTSQGVGELLLFIDLLRDELRAQVRSTIQAAINAGGEEPPPPASNLTH